MHNVENISERKRICKPILVRLHSQLCFVKGNCVTEGSYLGNPVQLASDSRTSPPIQCEQFPFTNM